MVERSRSVTEPHGATGNRLASYVSDELDGRAADLDFARMNAEEKRLRLIAKSSVLQMTASTMVDPAWLARLARPGAKPE
ncbi:hypothetical protein [Methylobacterium sp. SyP6R]|uniref:hypothetical protein n=1 Tax=Methylobacterium sp. SyP6R TaxID=2718876 RepID=UPI001F3E3F0A|nr:hypothetical protein [Methylobacterium sp. SyP6R]MCF4124960.1 hypothetical protein [Methylobacterium sp. SyP6R]